MRVKLMATATVLVAAVGLTGGAALLSHADAQPPDVVREIKDLTGALDAQEPGRGRPGGASSPGAPGGLPGGAPPSAGGFGAGPGGPPSGTWGAGGFGGVPAPNVEYKFVDIRIERKVFEQTITQQGKDGWEFCGSERFATGPRDGPLELTLVFKKVKPGNSTFMGSASGGGGTSSGSSAAGTSSGRSGQDPERGWQMLQRLTNSTGDTVDLNAIPSQTRDWLKSMAERNGGIPLPESGTMTKAQYLDYHARNEAARGAAGGSSGSRPGGAGISSADGSGRGSSAAGPFGTGGRANPSEKFLNVFALTTGKAEEMVTALKPLFPNADLSADPRTNTILARADGKALDELRALIARLEVLEPAKPK